MPASKRSRQTIHTVLGIDPGIARTGYGIIRGSTATMTLVAYGCIETDPTRDKHKRLKRIYDDMTTLLQTYTPDVIGIEQLFFAQNTTTAFKVGAARGVIELAAEQHTIPLKEFTPQGIKQTLTNDGRADKRQVQEMIKAMFKLKEIPKPDDAADGIACAVCMYQSLRSRR